MEEGDEIEGGENTKPNNLNLMWHLLEMVCAQPSRPERLVLFRLTCLSRLLGLVSLPFEMQFNF